MSVPKIFACAFLCLAARAQAPVQDAEQIQLLDRLISGALQPDRLKCEVEILKPFLDFAFRFQAGYIARCPLAQFEGHDIGVGAYLRIQPPSGPPHYLGEGFRMPAISREQAAGYRWQHFHDEAEFSGVFAAGAGEYSVDLILADDRSRAYHKSWRVRVAPGRNERKADLAMPAGSVAPPGLSLWQRSLEPHPTSPPSNGPQLTVLLDAAPVFPNSGKLRAWDRAFLLSSLSSLLRGVHPSSVRLIAFNLEQQREVYHQETFSREQFGQLVEALRNLELGTVSFKTLAEQGGWANLLTGFLRKEAQVTPGSDAVVFLGANNRNQSKIPRELLSSCDGLNARIYYLEFFAIPGYEFPDTIHQLTNTCHGSVFKLRSPVDLADAIAKLQVRLPNVPKSEPTPGS